MISTETQEHSNWFLKFFLCLLAIVGAVNSVIYTIAPLLPAKWAARIIPVGLSMLLIAILFSVGFSIYWHYKAKKGKINSQKYRIWLTVLLRYWLAFHIMIFGFEKLFEVNFAFASHLEDAPELADWPNAAAALRKRQKSVHCATDSVRHAQTDSADVDYRCHLPDLSALLPVYRQHPVPFNGPHPPQMARELATAYTQMIAVAPDRERIITVSFKRDDDDGPWRVQNPTPLMSGLADAFLPFFEWNEHLPDEAE